MSDNCSKFALKLEKFDIIFSIFAKEHKNLNSGFQGEQYFFEKLLH